MVLSVSQLTSFLLNTSLTSLAATQHCDVTSSGFPCVGDRCLCHRHHLLLIQGCYPDEQGHRSAAVCRLHALGCRRQFGWLDRRLVCLGTAVETIVNIWLNITHFHCHAPCSQHPCIITSHCTVLVASLLFHSLSQVMIASTCVNETLDPCLDRYARA